MPSDNSGGPSPWGNPSGGGSSGGGNSGGQRPGGPSGGGPSGGGPWGQGSGPGSRGPGSGQQMPDMDQIIAQAQAFIRQFMPGGGGGAGGARGLGLLGLGAVVLWLASGFFRVQPDELGIVLRFGAFDRQVGPGLNYRFPWPIEEVLKPPVTRVNRTEVGYRSGVTDTRVPQAAREGAGRDVLEESLMLTGDENIVDIDFAVFWRIRSAPDYLFNTRLPAGLVKAVAESAMREVIGRTPIQRALTELRQQIEAEVLKETQEILDQYKAGVEITQVQLQKVDPPHAVIDSFRDVQRANTDSERLRNEAESYRNDIIPRARGDSARILAEAEGFRQSTIAQANGQAQRFTSVLRAYQDAKDLTLKRMYIETMQDVLAHSQTVIVDDNVRGLVPFLPLGEGNRPAASPPTPPAQQQPQQQPQRGAIR